MPRPRRAQDEPLAALAAHPLADADVGMLAVKVEVTALERQQLRAADPGGGQQLEHVPVVDVDELHHQLHLFAWPGSERYFLFQEVA